jgi:cytidine deaminase
LDPDHLRTELVFGLVGAIGTDLERACEELRSILEVYGYVTVPISMSNAIRILPSCEDVPDSDFTYYERMIAGGDYICSELKDDGALADAAINAIHKHRQKPNKRDPDEHVENNEEAPEKPKKMAYVVRSFKRPGELERFRGVYGGMFYAIGVFADKAERTKRLARRVSEDGSDNDPATRANADHLISVDENERGKWGQKVSDTFSQVDCVVRSDARDEMRLALERFVTLVFAKPHVTPTIAEVAMMHAHAAALRSADLSRQIGAVIVARDGRVLVTGCNEVPRGGGGQYWESDIDDRRDFKLGHDLNDRKKRDAMVEVIARIKHLFRPEYDINFASVIYDGIKDDGLLDGTILDSLIEFGRVSHAEMSALTSATLGGVELRDCDLYTTTFPCHMCTRLIIACGIRNLFYIEPYPKSAALQMYGDGEIVVNPVLTPSQLQQRLHADEVSDKRTFLIPFDGVAPRRYPELFAKARSKDKREGAVLDFVPNVAKPRRAPDFTVMYESAEEYLADRWETNRDALRKNASAVDGTDTTGKS